MLDRRDFLRLMLASTIGGGVAVSTLRGIEEQLRGRTLILVEMAGGYDGLNLFIPENEYDLYRELRPTISEPLKNTRSIGGGTLLNRTLFSSLERHFDEGEMAIINGVSYPNHNLSHFKSRDVWNYGIEIDSNEMDLGWATRLLDLLDDKVFMASVLDENGVPFDGGYKGVLKYAKPFDFFDQAQKDNHAANQFLEDLKIAQGDSEFTRKKESIRKIIDTYRAKFMVLNDFQFSENRFGTQFQQALDLMSLPPEDRPYIIKLGFDIYDTHINQRNSDWAFQDISLAISDLASNLKKMGLWNDVLIYGYSEFGRTPYENGSTGTEHNGANNLFALGGRVKGGVYGRYPTLKDYYKEKIMVGDTDFRSIYNGIFQDFFGIKSSIFKNSSVDISPLRFVR